MGVANMKRHLLTYALVCSIAFARSEINAQESSKFTFSSIPVVEDALKDSAKDLTKSKDLDVSASDRTFLIGRDYSGYGPSGYGVGSSLPTASGVGLYGVYPGIGTGSAYGGSIAYPDTRLGTGYRSYQNPLRTGVVGGGHTGYGYYGSTGAAGFDDLGVYGGSAGAYGLPGSQYGGGYDDFSLTSNRRPGGYGGQKFIPPYGSYGGSGTYVGYGKNDGYGTNDYDSYQGRGIDGTYGNNYGTGSGYDPYAYRTGSYGRGYSTSRGYNVYPSGYRGYS
ncbi:keratin, type I cytoskeletal 10 isoform X2 [Cephus cinctus]|uniref:Keratin, type I cytoskeletal 10 isoform X2 n=1 Tax=Cephus cinctus TaxID=211228 RepID=A0AAJ7CBK7_CEPCN|nr:keratin, type I cytoskeletal 10 isoform X2 [Cephus cinctus]